MVDLKMTTLKFFIVFCVLVTLEYVDCRGRGGGGSRGGSRGFRSSSRGSSSSRSSGAWKTALFAGTLYGSHSYMMRRRYIDNPNKEPAICENNDIQTNQTTGATYTIGRFICPMRNQTDSMECCCGATGKQYCCDECGLSVGAIVGISLGSTIGFVILLFLFLWCCCSGDKKSKSKTKNTSSSANGMSTTYNNPLKPDPNDDMGGAISGAWPRRHEQATIPWAWPRHKLPIIPTRKILRSLNGVVALISGKQLPLISTHTACVHFGCVFCQWYHHPKTTGYC
ncbi:unnamed protein product [Owenia fusiformis]|uniref:Uncharacterized protein n=1 Tax=Owenia fusiformis TaxID=6347 RepID=A0A8S4PAB9_OWEFU|nr:unnamed protein product [Owenia fusiformis]